MLVSLSFVDSLNRLATVGESAVRFGGSFVGLTMLPGWCCRCPNLSGDAFSADGVVPIRLAPKLGCTAGVGGLV